MSGAVQNNQRVTVGLSRLCCCAHLVLALRCAVAVVVVALGLEVALGLVAYCSLPCLSLLTACCSLLTLQLGLI